jgi:lipoprotein-anchoring transpeptidase ErfK/SrfK
MAAPAGVARGWGSRAPLPVAIAIAATSLVTAQQGRPVPPATPSRAQAESSAPVSKTVALQAALDRAGFSPGEIDGSAGANTERALHAFCSARRINCHDVAAVGRALGDSADAALTTYTITSEDAAGPFLPEVPADPTAQAQLPALSYTSVIELVAEHAHAAPALLKSLNPGVSFAAGDTLRVPNVRRSLTPAGADASPATASRIAVSRGQSGLTVYDTKSQVVFFAPVTSGSTHDPLPIGHWTVVGVLHNPPFNYNPALFWDADPTDAKVKIPPGPNGPVGTVWIDLSKAHYGIHGTGEPSQIGHTTSHGCVRLTNWDAETVASFVHRGTPVIFER